MFRGISGNILRPAACKLIEKLSLSKIPFHGDEIIGEIYTARLLWPAMWCPITQLLHWYLH